MDVHTIPGMAAAGHVMTISRTGQISIPAAARARWQTQHVVVDLGDRVVVRPLTERPAEALQGKYRGRGPSADDARKQERRQERARGHRR